MGSGGVRTGVDEAPGAPRPAPRLRPPARAERTTLFEREVRERLSKSAIELMFRHAEVVSEGQRETRGGRAAYFGSTMITVDLAALAPALRDACDAATARRLAALAAEDAEILRRARAVAASEAARVSGARLAPLATEVRVRASGARVHIDIDVEGTP